MNIIRYKGQVIPERQDIPGIQHEPHPNRLLMEEVLEKSEYYHRIEIRGNGKTLVLRGKSFEIHWSGIRIK